jgi:MFS family permease
MPAIVVDTEVEPPAAEVFAYATDPSSKRSITRPSLSSRPVDAQNVPVRLQHKPTCQRRRSHGASERSPESRSVMPAISTAPDVLRTTHRWTLVLGSFASFLVGLDALVVTTALPTLHQELGAGIEGLSWTVNAYALAFAASILTGSTLGDRYGRRRMFIAGLAVFTIASAFCALSPTIALLIAARALQGIGGGIAVPLALALIIDATPPPMRGKALGAWGAITGVAVATGPLISGAIVEGLLWQWIFWLNVPVGIIIAVLTTRKVLESRRAVAHLDLVGLTLATLGVFGIAQALIRGNERGWVSASILGGLIGGTLALVLFVAWERRSGATRGRTR